MVSYKVKRLSDDKYYKLGSKFTKNGRIMSRGELEGTLEFLKSFSYDMVIESYETSHIMTIDGLPEQLSDIDFLIERQLSVNKILNIQKCK